MRTRKPVLAVVAIAIALVCAVLAWRRGLAPIGEFAETDQEQSSAPDEDRRASKVRPSSHRLRAMGHAPRSQFDPALFAPGPALADQPAPRPPAEERARDGFYERLMLQQGRDQAKEEQVRSKLMATFRDSPDTLVGAVACSAEFCRVDLRGAGRVDVTERWQKDLTSAVDPKGLRFFMVAGDDGDNTLASYYFGRDESWTVPDFHALGLL